MNKITMVQYGCGKMSKLTVKYALEKGIKIVGAFDINPNLIGKDISCLLSGVEELGVKILDAKEFEKFLTKKKVDVCVISTTSLMSEVYPAYEICAKCGVNAISTCEEAFYPQNSNPKLWKKLDALAKESECSLSGSGYQDIFWGNLISVLCGGTHKITKIKGMSSYNVEDYGIALANVHGAGLTTKEFEERVAKVSNLSDEETKKQINAGKFASSYMWNVNGWLTSKLGLHVTSQTQKCVPQIAKSDIKSSTLNMTIKKGDCTGMSAVVTTKTKEGIEIVSECIGKVYDKTEFDANDWTIEGEPSTRVVIERPQTAELTCASVINRIPELLCSPFGFTTTDQMPENFYKSEPLHTYVLDDDGCDCGCCHHE